MIDPWNYGGLTALLTSAIAASGFFLALGDGYFLADDFGWIRLFLDLPRQEAWRIFVGDLSLGIWEQDLNEYRPLWGLTFMADSRLWGADPRGYHATNILLHAAAGLLVWRFALRVAGLTARAAFLTLLFFALAAVHVQPVGWISARGHILVTIFMLASLLALQRFLQTGRLASYLGAIVAFLASLATVELAIALPAILLALDLGQAPGFIWRSGGWRRLAIHAPFWLILAAYVLFRRAIFGSVAPTGLELAVVQPTADVGLRGVRWGIGIWEVLVGTNDLAPALTVAVYALLFAVIALALGRLGRAARFSYSRVVGLLGLGWVLLTIAPIVGRSEQRHLYLASVGPALVLGLSTAHLLAQQRRRGLAVGLVIALIVVQGGLLTRAIVEQDLRGQLSWQLRTEIDATLARASQDSEALVVLVPLLPPPADEWVFWHATLPFAIEPPFTAQGPAAAVIPAHDAYCCPAAWATYIAGQLVAGAPGATYVVDWDPVSAAFTTRVLDSAEFRAAGYASADSRLLPPGSRSNPAPLSSSGP